MPSLFVRSVVPLLMAVGLAACGGANSPANTAANACVQWAQGQLNGKPLDPDAAKLLAGGAAEGSNVVAGGEFTLTAKLKVNAGLADEQMQDLECRVKVAEDGSTAEVLMARFIW